MKITINKEWYDKLAKLVEKLAEVTNPVEMQTRAIYLDGYVNSLGEQFDK